MCQCTDCDGSRRFRSLKREASKRGNKSLRDLNWIEIEKKGRSTQSSVLVQNGQALDKLCGEGGKGVAVIKRRREEKKEEGLKGEKNEVWVGGTHDTRRRSQTLSFYIIAWPSILIGHVIQLVLL
jgi:hypothetical protein